jgi:hypothetical protein
MQLKANTAPAAVTLFAAALLLFIGAFAAEQPVGGSVIKSFDPWSADRKFCGRLVIHVVGAGNVYQNPSKQDADQDILSKYTLANLEDFGGSYKGGLPSASILITSDAPLKKKALALAERTGTNHQLLIIPASADAFEQLLSDDTRVSALQSAIAEFATKQSCRDLTGPDESVLRYLKTEIVIESEHAPGGIPLWNSMEEDGAIGKWVAQDDAKVISSDLLAKLRAKLGQSVVQIFVEACSGAKLARQLQTTDQCSCYISLTDDETPITTGIKRSSGFSPAMKNVAATKRMTHYGSVSISSMIPKMLSMFEIYTMNAPDRSGGTSIFAGNRANPLTSFVYTSADSKTDEILKIFFTHSSEADIAEKLLVAGFSDEIKSAIESRLAGHPTNDMKSASKVDHDPDLSRVLAIVSTIRNQDAAYMKDIQERPGDMGYADEMRKFRNCTRFTNPARECRAISSLIRRANEGAAGGNQSDEDRNIIRERDAFLGNFDKLDVPNLIQQYRKGEIALPELCKRFHTLSIAFEEYRQHLSKYASGIHEDQSSELSSAFEEMRVDFHKSLWRAQQQLFPLLFKETLQVRLMKIEQTAKLLAEHEADMPEAKQELRHLANILTCQTLYPVGPAFDRIKNNSLPAMPSDTAAWSRN